MTEPIMPREPTLQEEAQADLVEKMRSKREIRSLELRKETWVMLEHLKMAFQHEDLEETVTTLADVGSKMVQLTAPHDRLVKMFGGERREIGEKCSTCGNQKTAFEREASVQLGREGPRPKPKPVV